MNNSDIVSMCCLSPEYFQIFVDLGFSRLASLFDGEHRSAFLILRGLYERYGSFDVQTMLLRSNSESKKCLKPYILKAKEDSLMLETADVLSCDSFIARDEEKNIIREELRDRIVEFRKHKIVEYSMDIQNALEANMMADIYPIVVKRNEIIEETDEHSKLNDWSSEYERNKNKQAEEGFPIGITSIDSHVKLNTGNIITIAGAPGVGKTSLANMFLMENFLNKDRPLSAVYFSLETDSYRMGRIWDSYLKSKGLDEDSIDEFHKEVNMRFTTTCADVNELIGEVDKLHQVDRDLKFVVVDYVQLLRDSKSELNPVIQLSSVVKKLTEANMRWGIVVVLLSQLNKESYGKNKEPDMSSLKGSGQLIENSSYIFTMHSPDETDGADHQYKRVICKLVKCRFAPCRSFNLLFNGLDRSFEPIPDNFGLKA